MRVPVPWVRCYAERPAATARVLCFPHAGGAASFFYPWLKLLPEHIEMWAVQYPGREQRMSEPLIGEMSALVDDVLGAVEPMLDLPTVAFGHSMGASVAYESALRLGDRLSTLVVSGRSGPARLRPPADPLHLAPDEAIIDRLDVLGGVGPRLLNHPALRTLIIPVVRNDLRIVETYRPSPGPLSIDVIALGGDDDPTMPAENLAAWADVTTGRFTQKVYQGGHFYLADHLDDVVAHVVGVSA